MKYQESLFKMWCVFSEREMSKTHECAQLFVGLVELDSKGITPQFILQNLVRNGLWLAKLLSRKNFGTKNPSAGDRHATKFDDFAEIFIARCGDEMLKLFCHVAVTENGLALRFVPKKYRDDLYEIAVRNHPKMIRLVPREKRTISMYQICARHGKSTYMFFSKDERKKYGIDETKEYRELYDANNLPIWKVGYLSLEDTYTRKLPNGIDKLAKCRKRFIGTLMENEGRYKNIDIFSLVAENPFCIKYYGFSDYEAILDNPGHIRIRTQDGWRSYKHEINSEHLLQIYSFAAEKNILCLYLVNEYYYYRKIVLPIGKYEYERGVLSPENKYYLIDKFIGNTPMKDEEIIQLMRQAFNL